MSSAETPITAVHEDDALELLESLGILDAYNDGSLACSICGGEIRAKGLGAARLQEGKVVFACEDLTCLHEFHGEGVNGAAVGTAT